MAATRPGTSQIGEQIMFCVKLGSVVAAAALLAGCATTPGGQRLAERDPLEKFNRAVWDANMAVDKVAIKPASKVYTTVTPKAGQRGIHNIFENLGEPLSFINALLQGKVGKAFHTLGRFAINTTIGVGGLADHATALGLEEQSEDFGQTLAVWGVNAGPYLVLPLLGPSTLRDGVGTGVEFVGDPSRIAIRKYSGLTWTQRLGITALEIVDLRAELTAVGGDAFLRTSLDPYTTARTAYLQRRQAQILDQLGGENNVNPADFDISPESGAAAPAGIDPRDFETTPDDPAVPETKAMTQNPS